MTSATLNDHMNARTSSLVGKSACMQHGLLDATAKDCPRCGRQAYQLDDEGDRATLRAFHKASLKARIRNFAIGGYVAFIAVKSALWMALGLGMTLELVSVPGAVCAGLGAAFAYLVRRPSQRRLDALLR